jgi:mandelate racemase
MTNHFNAAIEITGIRLRRLMVPLRRPLKVSFGTFKEGPFLAVEVETKGGITGRVLGFTFHRLGLTVVPPVLQHLATFAKGRSVSYPEMGTFHDACQKNLMLLGHEGVTQMALSMFDMAVHDALAKANGVPLHQLLGGTAVDIPAYNSCGGSIIPAKEAAAEARELVAERGGFQHVKVRLGRASLAEDVAALRAIRDAVGPELLLSADFNQALPGASAYDTCRAIDDLGLTWIEEPVVFDDYDTQARLARKLRTPLQIGETWWHWRVGKRAIEMGTSDYIMPDILRIGGVTGWMRLAAIAQQHAVPFSSHLSPEYSAHVLAATPTRHWLEYMDWAQDLITDPVVPVKGIARPGTKPGAGVEFNEAALAKFVVKE